MIFFNDLQQNPGYTYIKGDVYKKVEKDGMDSYWHSDMLIKRNNVFNCMV